MSFFVSIIENIIFLPYVFLGFLLLLVAKFFFDWTTPRYQLDTDIIENKHYSVALMYIGYLLGVAVVIAGSFYGLSSDHLTNGIDISVSALLGILLLRISFVINDKLILHRFDIEKEIQENNNLGLAFVVASSSIASGLTLAGIMQGVSNGLLQLVTDIVLYWLLGQFFLVLSGAIFQWITPYDMHSELLKNKAVAFSFSGFLIGIGLIIKEGFTGLDGNLLSNIVTASLFSLWGLFLLFISRGIVDKILLSKTRINTEITEKQNWAIGIVVGAGFIALGLFVAGIHWGVRGL